MMFLVALGPRLSIGITIEVTPFNGISAAWLLLFLLEESLLIVAYAVSPRAMGSGSFL
jgi:hypothetical protein